MCDTQLIRQNGETFFAKNSDREPSEAQVVCYVPPVENEANRSLQATYITLPQVSRCHGMILSKPFWMWGAEMGVNDCGVVIGNEAVFTRLVDKKCSALLGMDLVRLGLERGDSARQALDCITQLLETHGQGGPAGYRDKSFYYDNSFIVADAGEAWVLETAGRHWVAKQIKNYGAISNALSIEEDFDLSSSGLADFAKKHNHSKGVGSLNFARAFDTRFMKRAGSALRRRSASMNFLREIYAVESASFSSMASSLRQHASYSDDFSRHANRDVCMHAGGLTRPSQTCGSMIVRLREGAQPQLMVTGTSAPCISLFQPVWFPHEHSCEQSLFFDEKTAIETSLWFQFECVHRLALLDKEFRTGLLSSRDEFECKLFAAMETSGSYKTMASMGKQWHDDWYALANVAQPRYRWHSRYDQYWKRLNRLDRVF